jgi:hypothetical protein
MLFEDTSSSSPAHGDASRARPAHAPRAATDPCLIETAAAPEPEALGATRLAAAVVRDLHEAGCEVRFTLVPTSSRVTVLLCDMDGAVLSRLSPARALEIAAGSPVAGALRH